MSATGFIFQNPRMRPTGTNGNPLPNCYWIFYYTNTTTKAPIYSDSTLLAAASNPLLADGTGLFPVVYMDPTITYRTQLYDQYNKLQYDSDPGALVPAIADDQVICKNASTAYTTGTFVNDPELTIALSAGTYQFEIMLVLTSLSGYTGNGFVIGVSSGNTSNNAYRSVGYSNSDGKFVDASVIDVSQSQFYPAVGNTSVSGAFYYTSFTTGTIVYTLASNLTVACSQSGTPSSAIFIRQGSYMKIIEAS